MQRDDKEMMQVGNQNMPKKYRVSPHPTSQPKAKKQLWTGSFVPQVFALCKDELFLTFLKQLIS